ncbi:MAG: hypothetical protein IPP12_22145 [Nitrospira sp.]|nr:hypothetical protein [Nitrospira sp.]
MRPKRWIDPAHDRPLTRPVADRPPGLGAPPGKPCGELTTRLHTTIGRAATRTATMTRWHSLALTLMAACCACAENYCPTGPVVFAVDDPRVLPAVETSTEQLGPHMAHPVDAALTEHVTPSQWHYWDVWRVVNATEDDQRTIACDPFAEVPGAFVYAETSYSERVIFVCDTYIGEPRLKATIMHEVGHALGGVDHPRTLGTSWRWSQRNGITTPNGTST